MLCCLLSRLDHHFFSYTRILEHPRESIAIGALFTSSRWCLITRRWWEFTCTFYGKSSRSLVYRALAINIPRMSWHPLFRLKVSGYPVLWVFIPLPLRIIEVDVDLCLLFYVSTTFDIDRHFVIKLGVEPDTFPSVVTYSLIIDLMSV